MRFVPRWRRAKPPRTVSRGGLYRRFTRSSFWARSCGRWWSATASIRQRSTTSLPDALARSANSRVVSAGFAAEGVIAGVYDIVIAAGVESMSRIPMFTSRIGQDPYGPAVLDRYAPGLIPQGVSAELVAARFKLDRETLDEYSARSHVRAGAADFSGEIVPISVPGPDGGTVV